MYILCLCTGHEGGGFFAYRRAPRPVGGPGRAPTPSPLGACPANASPLGVALAPATPPTRASPRHVFPVAKTRRLLAPRSSHSCSWISVGSSHGNGIHPPLRSAVDAVSSGENAPADMAIASDGENCVASNAKIRAVRICLRGTMMTRVGGAPRASALREPLRHKSRLRCHNTLN